MDKLRGTGSTSGKRWMPFRHNPKLAKRNARLHRTLKAGTIQRMSKAGMRHAAQAAAQALMWAEKHNVTDVEVINAKMQEITSSLPCST